VSRAVCVKCGADRTAYEQTCPSCGHRPEGEGLLVAWLLSDLNLSEAELDATRDRIRGGGTIRPSARMLDKARRALGSSFATDLGMSTGQRVGLLATSLFLTPLVGIVLFAWWWNVRPRAAVQALALSLPATVLFTAVVLWW
jgi:hypothetical protein